MGEGPRFSMNLEGKKKTQMKKIEISEVSDQQKHKDKLSPVSGLLISLSTTIEGDQSHWQKGRNPTSDSGNSLHKKLLQQTDFLIGNDREEDG